MRQHGVSAWGNVWCYECSNFTSLPVRVLMKLHTEIPPERQAVTIKMEQYTLWKYFAQNQCKVGEERVYVQVGHVECKWNNAMTSSRLWLLNFTHAPHIIAFKPLLVNASFVCQYLCNAIFLTLLGKYVFSMTSRDPAPFHLVASSGIDEDARENTTWAPSCHS